MSTILARVVHGAADLCQAEVAVVTMRMPNPDRLVLLDVFGTGGVMAEKALPTGESLNGMVVTRGRTFRSGDVWRERRPIVRSIALRNRVRSLIIAPFATPDGLSGTLAVARRTVREFSARDEAVLENFAHITGVTLRSTDLGPYPWTRTQPPRTIDRTLRGAFAEIREQAPPVPESSQAQSAKVVCLDRYREVGISPDDEPLNAEWDRLAHLVEEAWTWRDPDSLAALDAWVAHLRIRLREEWKP